MRLSPAFILAACVGQVVATGWHNAKPYSVPDIINNQCSDEQKKGYDWSGLTTGSFSSYGSNEFSGFSCSNSFGKRDPLLPRTFKDKCITGDVQKHPSISCDTGKSMSIDTMHVSAEHDTHLECHYDMPDGSTCKTQHSCSSNGSIIKNDQCGGAIGVTFKPVEGNGKSCSIGVHDISFNCGSSSSSSTLATSTKPATSLTTQTTTPVTTTSVKTTETTSVPVYYTTSSSSASSTSSQTTQSLPTSSSSTLSIPVYIPSSSVVTSSKTESIPVYTQSQASSSTPVAPPTQYTTTSTIVITSSTTQSSVSPATSSPAPQCPGVLPSCLNTWLHETQCTDNSDYDCFCKDSTFVSHVMGCLEAWAGKDDTHQAASYFQGLCAAYIPQNPAIVTACPKVPVVPASVTPYTTTTISTVYTTSISTGTISGTTVTVTKTVPVTTTVCPVTITPSSAAVNKSSPAPTSWTVPTTVVTYSTVLTVQVTCSTGESAGSIIPGSSTAITVQTTLTAPQVYLTSNTATASGTTSTVTVGLAAGTPASAPAKTTGMVTAYGSASRPVIQPTGTAAAVYTGAATSFPIRGLTPAFIGGLAALLVL